MATATTFMTLIVDEMTAGLDDAVNMDVNYQCIMIQNTHDLIEMFVARKCMATFIHFELHTIIVLNLMEIELKQPKSGV